LIFNHGDLSPSSLLGSDAWGLHGLFLLCKVFGKVRFQGRLLRINIDELGKEL